MLTFSFSDRLVARGYKYIFRDTAAPTSGSQYHQATKGAGQKVGRSIKTAALIGDNTGASVAYFKSLNEALPQSDVQIVLNRVWTPPLTDAIPVALAVRDANPELFSSTPPLSTKRRHHGRLTRQISRNSWLATVPNTLRPNISTQWVRNSSKA